MEFVNVRCDMATDGGGWIVFQRRVDASLDFYRGWEEYKHGFGDLNGNFWLGLETVHMLTSAGKIAKLRVDVKHFNPSYGLKYAEYSGFKILSETEGYRLNLNGYSGNAGNSLSYHNNRMFTTKDRDQDSNSGNCATIYKGAWWYNTCHYSNLNGLYPQNKEEAPTYMSWRGLSGKHGGIVFSEMKMKFVDP